MASLKHVFGYQISWGKAEQWAVSRKSFFNQLNALCQNRSLTVLWTMKVSLEHLNHQQITLHWCKFITFPNIQTSLTLWANMWRCQDRIPHSFVILKYVFANKYLFSGILLTSSLALQDIYYKTVFDFYEFITCLIFMAVKSPKNHLFHVYSHFCLRSFCLLMKFHSDVSLLDTSTFYSPLAAFHIRQVQGNATLDAQRSVAYLYTSNQPRNLRIFIRKKRMKKKLKQTGG